MGVIIDCLGKFGYLRNPSKLNVIPTAVVVPGCSVLGAPAGSFDVTDRDGNTFLLCLDKIVVVDSRLTVMGWTDAPALRIEIAGRQLCIALHSRQDVAAARGLEEAAQLGFAALADLTDGQLQAVQVELTITMANCRPFVTMGLPGADALESYEALRLSRSFAAELGGMSTLPPCSPAWRDMRDRLSSISKAPAGVQGYLEGGLAIEEGGLIAYGWVLHPADMPIWIEEEFGAVQSLVTAFRRPRGDVTAAFVGTPWAEMECGFIMYLADMDATATLRMCAATVDGVVTLSVANWPEALPAAPALAAQRLFGLDTEDHIFHRRVPIVDMPVLGPLIERRQTELAALPVTITDFGDLPSAPAVSIIMPLYRRFDFIEHDLMEFVHDSQLLAIDEIIYVTDDTSIHISFLNEIQVAA